MPCWTSTTIPLTHFPKLYTFALGVRQIFMKTGFVYNTVYHYMPCCIHMLYVYMYVLKRRMKGSQRKPTTDLKHRELICQMYVMGF